MLDYPSKILIAFGETFTDNGEEFYNWLLENGYPELAALSSGIRGSHEAINWLLKNKYPQYAALDGAIDNKEKAYEFDFLVVFADAVNVKPYAIKWLRENNLEFFFIIAKKISDFRNKQTFDYHKLHW